MESVPVRRKSCLLRLRQNCPFRKLCRQTYDVSAATSSPFGSYWNNVGASTSNEPISTVFSEPLPRLTRCQSVCSPDRSEAAADVQMEDDPSENHLDLQSPESDVQDCMDLDDDVDPETGERAQG